MTERARPPKLDLVVVNSPARPPTRNASPPATERDRTAVPPALAMAAVSKPPKQGELTLPCPVYRVVFTTMGAIFADGEVSIEGALIRWGNGSVTYGYSKSPDAFPGRDGASFVIPERGALVPAATGRWRYESRGPVRRFDGGTGADLSQPGPVFYEYAGGTLDDVFYVEIFVEIQDTAPKADAIAQGRGRAASIKALIDLFFGPRVLAAQITEEVGRLSADGEYEQVGELDRIVLEWTAQPLLMIEPRYFEGWATDCLARLIALPDEARRRIDLACDWYWRALETVDPVISYLQYWFVLEVAAMPTTTDIGPACEKLQYALGGDSDSWRDALKPLRNLRGAIAHSGQREVDCDKHALLAAFAQVFIGLELGVRPETSTTLIRSAAGLT